MNNYVCICVCICVCVYLCVCVCVCCHVVPHTVTGVKVHTSATTEMVFANVSWMSLDNSNGPILDYTVSYGTSNDSLFNETTTNALQSSIIIPNLEVGAGYYVTVQGRTRIGLGQLGDIVYATGSTFIGKLWLYYGQRYYLAAVMFAECDYCETVLLRWQPGQRF